MPRSIKEALFQIRKGSLNHLELAERSLNKQLSLSHLNAFTFVASKKDIQNQDEKINNRVSKDNLKHLPLRGIPIAVKDNFCVENMPATCGSHMLKNFRPPYTATVIQKLIDAGALIIGKTNLDEFGMGNGTLDSIFGPTKNIWGLDKFKLRDYSFTDWYVPGGSSGGSAQSVASGICLGAIGSDTGGSIRNPASYSGLVGLKPTYGVLSRYGLIPLVNSLDVPGILTKSVEDCAILFNILKGFDSNDSTSLEIDLPSIQLTKEFNVKNLHIGIPDPDFICPGMNQEVIDTWREISDLLERNGAKVSNVKLPHTKYAISCYSVLNPCEVASNMARYDGLKYGHRSNKKGLNSTESLFAQTRHEGFNTVVRGRILAGNYFLLKENYEKYFMQAMKVRRLISNDFLKLWTEKKIDLMLTPVTLSAAPKYTEFIKWDNRKQSSVQDYCTQSSNLAGIPSLSLPIKLNNEGLPLSLQIIGPFLSEQKIMNIAKFIENHVQFPHLNI